MSAARTWDRVKYREKCGRCGKLLKAGDPVLSIAFSGMKRALLRCEDCEGPAPPDLPERPVFYSVKELAELEAQKPKWKTFDEAPIDRWLPHSDD